MRIPPDFPVWILPHHKSELCVRFKPPPSPWKTCTPASSHTNETASANSPCPEHEKPATHRVRMSSPGVPQSPRARRFQFPAVPPSPSVVAPPVSRWRPSDCELLLPPDKDCCCG